MDFAQIWPRLSDSSRAWLMEHNGEPLPDELVGEILGITKGELEAEWWAGKGQTQLTDETVDWIAMVANGEG